MNLIVTKVRSLEIDEALARVIEASRDMLSAEVSCFMHRHRKLMAAVVLGVGCALLGVALMAVGIRDALLHAFPNYAIQAVIGAGAFAMLCAFMLLRASSRFKG